MHKLLIVLLLVSVNSFGAETQFPFDKSKPMMWNNSFGIDTVALLSKDFQDNKRKVETLGGTTVGPDGYMRLCDGAELVVCGGKNKHKVTTTPTHELLLKVNKKLNAQIKYTPDLVQFKKDYVHPEDVWIVADTKGDCEDYAMSKYQELLELGVSPQDMRIAEVMYTESSDDIMVQGKTVDHAILVVTTPEADYVLDNRHDEVLDWKAIDNYRWIRIQIAGTQDWKKF